MLCRLNSKIGGRSWQRHKASLNVVADDFDYDDDDDDDDDDDFKDDEVTNGNATKQVSM